MSHAAQFSVVVLNWNSGAFLQRCVAALRAQTDRAFELICVDNGSTDGSAEWLRTADLAALAGAPARVMRLPRNCGFAAGMNAGLRAATGAWLVPLNVDVVLAPDFLAEARAFFARHPQAGAAGATVCKYTDQPTNVILASGMWLTRHFSVATSTRAAGVEAPVFGPNGCCPVFARAALVATQLEPARTGAALPQYFDEVYFAYGEDVDLYMRLALAGYPCIYSPRLRAWHAHSGTQAGVRLFEKDNATLARVAANQVFTWLKNSPPRLLLACAPWVAATIPGMCLRLLRRQPWRALAPLRAYGRILRLLPRTLRLRRRLQHQRVCTSAPFFAMLIHNQCRQNP
ncbi:MAG: glycosyltransferase family 2 protein [bacterium]|nr:glycosyltransferase family 2 protein [bacterium]